MQAVFFVYCCCTFVACPVVTHDFLLFGFPAFALLNAPAELLFHKNLQQWLLIQLMEFIACAFNHDLE